MACFVIVVGIPQASHMLHDKSGVNCEKRVYATSTSDPSNLDNYCNISQVCIYLHL